MKKILEGHLNNLIKTLLVTKNELDIIDEVSNTLLSSIKNKKKIFV